MSKRHTFVHLVAGLALGLLGLSASTSSMADVSFGEKSVPLTNFTIENGPIRIAGISDSFDVYIPLASTAEISNTWLDLQFTHSVVLLSNRSSLRVLFNDTTLTQIQYDPAQPAAKARVRIPDELWKTGFNKLSLSVIQHYIDRCEDTTSPELWTEFDLKNSLLSYTVDPVDRELQLRDLSGIFSPGIGGLNTVLLLTSPKANLSKPSTSYLNAVLPLVSQSLALRREYSPLTVEHGRWIDREEIPESQRQSATTSYLPNALAPEGHVLIGTKAELAAILPSTLLDQINGPFLHLHRFAVSSGDNDTLRRTPGIRLIVSGVSGTDVLQASRALAEINDNLSGLQQFSVLKDDMRAAGGYFLHPDTLYTFADLGRPTITMHGPGTKRVNLNLPIRGNFYTHESATVELLLDFAYSAGMGTGSVMSVFLNEEYVQGLELKKTGGMAYRSYRINLPAHMLHPGINTLKFEFNLLAETAAGECRNIPASHLFVQMLDSSKLRLPKASAVASQPDLATFSATAFPYIANTHAVRTELVVGTENMLGDALSLAGKLAQLSRSPSEQLVVRTTIPSRLVDNTILLATPQEMPSSIFASMAESLERTQRWPHRIFNLVRNVQANPTKTPAQLMNASLIHNGGLDSLGVLISMRNPHSASPAALTVISADNHALLTQRITDLLTPQIWGQLKGDLVVWEDPEDAVIAMQVGDYYEVGEKDHWHRLILTLSNNPWYTVASLLFTILAISLLTRSYLRKREAQKLAE